jgi:primosomal protein N' (replication factor Y)
LPLAIYNALTYVIPERLVSQVKFGVRVEVSLRNKLYSGIVTHIHHSKPDYKTKEVLNVLDQSQIITEAQYELWKWMSEYYCCSLGEVMSVALPSGLKLSSETKLIFNPSSELNTIELSDDEYLVSEALSIQNELTILLIQDILNKKTVYPIIRSLLDKKILYIKEELIEKYKPKTIDIIELEQGYSGGQGNILALDKVRRSELQTRALLAIFNLKRKDPVIKKDDVKTMAEVDTQPIKALEKKGIISISKSEISRLGNDEIENSKPITLSDIQAKATNHISSEKEGTIHLLHGVTGSGKTSIYIELIKKVIAKGGQVLYLLPEIALTSQIVQRLEVIFDKDLLVYHSRINNNDRVEIWKEVIYKRHLVVGARSSVFLPFHNLKLIIVDEEHDSSFKQDNPAPRYNARDTASYLSRIYGAKVILGSATPSVESYQNVIQEKYAYTHLSKRYGDINLPTMELVDLSKMLKTGRMKGSFSITLKDAIENALEEGEQVLLFQNRRGYSPIIKCAVCGWTAECTNCDVSLTYHQHFNEMRCHYCGYKSAKPSKCGACGSDNVMLLGLGTEKIEEEINELFPKAIIRRFDYDTANTKRKYQDIIDKFEQKEIDILVGTQMISKGFDFDNISLVGVLNADALLSYPDFRSEERTFQLLTQVGGRAGRRSQQGRVIIQTYNPSHPVLQDVIGYDIQRFYSRELKNRRQYVYPPFYRLINVWFRHKKMDVLKDASQIMYEDLQKKYKTRIGPPHDPPLVRVRGYYQQLIVIKLEKNNSLIRTLKEDLMETRSRILDLKPFRSVRIGIDVDPY